MSETASLPGYAQPPTFVRTPAYSAHPRGFEERIAFVQRPPPRPSTSFVKQSKYGGLSLRLAGQQDDGRNPVYGCGSTVEGAVHVHKADNISAVEIKIEGVLTLKEIAGSGTVAHSLCLNHQVLWSKEREGGRCPESLEFSLPLPTTFSDDRVDYPLPPSYEVELHGVPGFSAYIKYSVKAIATKIKTNLFSLGNTTISTPFTYLPRTRPATQLPSPLLCFPNSHGFVEHPEWGRFESRLTAKASSLQDIIARLYLPQSRIFCLQHRIPFHVTFAASAFALASFMPFAPSPSLLMPTKPSTRIQLIRQSICDVRNDVVLGTKTDMWRTDLIGEGLFSRAGDGSDWLSFNGEIEVSKDVTVGGFKAGGLFIKDYIVLSMTPPDPTKCPLNDMRLVVPVRLTTDPWTSDGFGDRYEGSLFSIPSDPDDYVEALPELPAGQAL